MKLPIDKLKPVVVQSDDNINNMLQKFNESQNKNETVEVLKQLFDHEKLNKISDLSPDAINLIIAIDTVGETYDFPIYKKVTERYIELQLSKNRKSRKEVIEAIKGHNTNQQNSLGDRMRNVFQR